MNVADMKEKRNRLVVEASSLVKTEMNAETRAKIDTIYADADAIKGDIERAERAESLEAEMRSSTALPSSPLAGTENASKAAEVRSENYKLAHAKYLRKGEHGLTFEERNLLETVTAEVRTQSGATAGSGGYTIPVTLADSIEVALKFYGGMRSVAKVIKTSGGGTLNWPTNNDTSNVGAILSGSAAEQDLTFGSVPFGAFTYTTKQIPVQKELLQDSAFDLEEFIREAFVNRIGRIQNTHFTVGTGTTMPNGIVTVASTGITAATGGATAVTYNNLVDISGSVDVAYRMDAKFMFNDLTLTAIRKIVDTQGRPLLGLGLNGAVSDSILGYKYVVNNDIPVMAANAKSILFGDFSKYMIRDVANTLEIVRLNELGALSNQVIFVGFVRGDGQLIDAGTGPVKVFANSST
jgi:HK97 family phage major capsid protein